MLFCILCTVDVYKMKRKLNTDTNYYFCLSDFKIFAEFVRISLEHVRKFVTSKMFKMEKHA